MSYITTFTGKHFDPIEIDPDLIDLADIAHALSLLCRANGHFPHFYSVAQHCVNCYVEAGERMYTPRVQLACLLHDAAEAYMTDLPRPVKELLPDYCRAEDVLLDAIWVKYLGTLPAVEDRRQVFAVDDDMLSYEFLHLMSETLSEDYRHIRSCVDLTCRNPSDMEETYLRISGFLLRKVREGA